LNFKKISCLALSTIFMTSIFCSNSIACLQQTENAKPLASVVATIEKAETTIVLSDSVIMVNGNIVSSDSDDAVYISNDIVYYEDKDLYESGNPYGEGTAKDKHSKTEADAHTVVNITKPGTYRISGKLSKGQISIDLGKDAKRDPNAVVTLILDGVDITNTVAPAVIFYNVFECNTDWVAYDEGEVPEYTAEKDVNTTGAGANVIIADGSVNSVNGSYVARIYKDNTEAKKKHKYDGAFYSKMSMNIDDQSDNSGVLNIVAANEGLDTEMHLTINGGKINISSQNDGINTNEDGVSVTTINGGSLHIVAGLGEEGDGVDSNGYLVINGGVVISTAKPMADSGLDADLGSYINGGYVVATGSTMDWAESDSDQVTMNLQFASQQDNTEAIIITDTNNNVVFAYDPDKDETTGVNNRGYQGAVISSPDLKMGSTYYVYIGGDIAGNETDGLYDISSVIGFSGGTRQVYTGTDVRGFRGGMGGMRPEGFGMFEFGGRMNTMGIDMELATFIYQLILRVDPASTVTVDDIMACTSVQELMSLVGMGNKVDAVPNGNMPVIRNMEIPVQPGNGGGMFGFDDMNRQMATPPLGDIFNFNTMSQIPPENGDMFMRDRNFNFGNNQINNQTIPENANFEFYMNDKVNAFSGVTDGK